MNKLLSIDKYWAMEPDSLRSLASNMEAFSFTDNPSLRNTRFTSIRDGTAIISIKGPITSQDTLFSFFLGGTPLDVFVKDFQKALKDKDVKAILLDIDSPGGVAIGPSEVAEMIYSARSKKPVWSYIGRNGCSAAYWLASAAEKVIAHRSALVGSIGVVTTIPVQEQPDQEGYRNIEIVSSNAVNKRPDPRTTNGMSEIRRELDSLEQEFIESIAKYRNVDVNNVRQNFGHGGVVVGRNAQSANMVDSLGSFEEVIQSLTTISYKSNNSSNSNKGETNITEANNPSLPTNALQKEQITAEFIKTEFPNIYEALKQEGFKEGEKGNMNAKTLGIQEGREAERNRLLAIENASLPGHEDLVSKAKSDPEMTAEKLALQIIAAEKARGSEFVKAAQAAENNLPKIAPSVAAVTDSNKIDPNAPLETRSQAEWDGDPKIRAEFSNDYDTYLAYRSADENQQVKILGKGGK